MSEGLDVLPSTMFSKLSRSTLLDLDLMNPQNLVGHADAAYSKYVSHGGILDDTRKMRTAKENG